jgi:hypothetical protein
MPGRGRLHKNAHIGLPTPQFSPDRVSVLREYPRNAPQLPHAFTARRHRVEIARVGPPTPVFSTNA